MKKFSVLLLLSLLLATPLLAQGVPQVGVYFDTAATVDHYGADAGQLVNAYVIAVGGPDVSYLMGGVAFALDMPAGVSLLSATNAIPGVQIPSTPDLVGGQEIGFYDPVFVDAGHPRVIYNLLLMVTDHPMNDLAISVVAHPNYGDVVVVRSDGQADTTTGLTGYVSPPFVVGVYADAAATSPTLTPGQDPGVPFTAYVVATGGPRLLGGAAFKLDLPPSLQLAGVAYPPSIQIGDPLYTGLEIGFYDPQFQDATHPVLLATLYLVFPDEGDYPDSDVCVVGHPAYGDQVIGTNSDGQKVVGQGACGHIPHVIANEDRTWSQVKDLYR